MKKMKLSGWNILAMLLIMLGVMSSCDDENKDNSGNGAEMMIAGFTPEQGYSSNEITITGKNFGTEENHAEVYFNETMATEYVSCSDTEIKVKVPVGASTGKISVLKDGGYAFSEKNFTYLEGAALEGISTGSSYIGDEIIITGKNFFDVEPANVKVYFGDAVTTATGVSETEIRVNVPQDVNAGEVNVSVEFVGYQTVSGLVFNVIANPQITSIAPVSGLGGNEVTITGQNFYGADDEFGNIKVFFDDREAVVTSVNSGQIKVQAPVPDEYIEDGYLDVSKVTVKYDGREDMVWGDGTTSAYKILLPKVISVSPKSLGIGSELTIKGENFYTPSKDNLNIHVFVGNMEVDGGDIIASASEIKFKISEGATTGTDIDVYVKFDTPISGKSYSTKPEKIEINATAWYYEFFIRDCAVLKRSDTGGALKLIEYDKENESSKGEVWRVEDETDLTNPPVGYDPSKAKTLAMWDFYPDEYAVFKVKTEYAGKYWLSFDAALLGTAVCVSCGESETELPNPEKTESINTGKFNIYKKGISLPLGDLESGKTYYIKVGFEGKQGGCVRNLTITNTEPEQNN